MINDRPGTPAELTPHLNVALTWSGKRVFDVGKPGRPSIRLDSDSQDGPSPPEALLCALAGCTAVDVLDILEKRRTPATSLDINVIAERKDATPRRISKVHLAYTIVGPGVERVHAERAIELAVTKYCTVRDTLDPEMPVHWSLELREA